MLKMRIAEKIDIPLIAAHNCAMAMETENKMLDPKVATLGVEGLFTRPHFGFYLVADVDQMSAATLMVTYEWSDWRNGLFWWIQSVYVKEEFRRQGLYSAMYEQLLRTKISGPRRLIKNAACMPAITLCLSKVPLRGR
jgi:GNAT superfamily N-acetyltransferase